MLRATLNKSWRQHPTKQQLYGHLPPISTIQIRRTRHARHCWGSKDELTSDVLQWTSSHGRASVGRPAGTYIQQLCTDTGCRQEYLSEAIDNRDGWWERVREIRASSTTWWWSSSSFTDELATIVEGDPKVPFSIATTPRCRGGRYSFLAPLYAWSVLYKTEC